VELDWVLRASDLFASVAFPVDLQLALSQEPSVAFPVDLLLALDPSPSVGPEEEQTCRLAEPLPV